MEVLANFSSKASLEEGQPPKVKAALCAANNPWAKYLSSFISVIRIGDGGRMTSLAICATF